MTRHRGWAHESGPLLLLSAPTFSRIIYINPFRSAHHGHLPGNRIRARQYRLHQVSAALRRLAAPLLTHATRLALPTFPSSLRARCPTRPGRYWGKRDTSLILPTNPSLSVTLDQDHLRSTTTARADPAFEGGDRLWLNGVEETIKEGGRLGVCIHELRAWRRAEEDKDGGLVKVGRGRGEKGTERARLTWLRMLPPQLSSYSLHIASYNNFPTAAGLASSASGLAALVASLAQLYALPQSPSQLSLIARQGSGSACRSLFGGFVAWRAGSDPSGADSLAQEVAPRAHWPEMHALICVVSDAKKGTSSTAGMQRTVQTSTLLQHRIEHVVPQRMAEIERAIHARDFPAFAQLTMRDSNSFHAVCLDTDPPIFYLNDVSKAIIALVTELNRAAGRTLAAYTFDAGPNAVIYALEADMPLVVRLVGQCFPPAEAFPDPFGIASKAQAAQVPEGLSTAVVGGGGNGAWEQGAVKSLIHTRVGDGPRRLSDEESLLGEDGLPKTVAK